MKSKISATKHGGPANPVSGQNPKLQKRSSVIVVLVTCPTRAVARRIASQLVRRHLAACVNVIPGLTSVFRWEGKMESAREVLLVIKTTNRQFEPLRRAILQLHPYKVPEIIALPVIAGHRPYLKWVAAS